MAEIMEVDEELARKLKVKVIKRKAGAAAIDPRSTLCGATVQKDPDTGDEYFIVPACHVPALKAAHPHYEYGAQYVEQDAKNRGGRPPKSDAQSG